MALPDRPVLVGRSRREAESPGVGHRRDGAELPRRLRHRERRRGRGTPAGRGRRTRVSELAVIGNLSRDVVAGSEPRPGGGVFWSTRALARIGARAVVSAACSAEDRPLLLPPLEAFGIPVTWHESSSTTAYSFHYDGDRRIMRVTSLGDPWSPAIAVAAAQGAGWIDACALTRGDF